MRKEKVKISYTFIVLLSKTGTDPGFLSGVQATQEVVHPTKISTNMVSGGGVHTLHPTLGSAPESDIMTLSCILVYKEVRTTFGHVFYTKM